MEEKNPTELTDPIKEKDEIRKSESSESSIDNGINRISKIKKKQWNLQSNIAQYRQYQSDLHFLFAATLMTKSLDLNNS